MSQKIRALAYWTDYLIGQHGRSTLLHGADVVPGIIQGRAQQIVHAGIHDRKIAFSVVLQVFHTGKQKPGIADQRPTGLKQYTLWPLRQHL
jgi:hypothetical protein